MLASHGVSIFYLCTYQTDFLLVKETKVDTALNVLRNWALNLSNNGNFELLTENSQGKVVPLDLHNEISQIALKSSVFIDDFFRLKVQKGLPRSIGDINLTIAGLNVDLSDSWALIVIKLLLYSEEFVSKKSNMPKDATLEHQERFISFTSSPEGVSLIAEEDSLSLFEEHVLNRDLTIKTLKLIHINLVEFDLDTHGIVHSLSYPLASADLDLLYLSTFSSANLLVKNRDLTLVKEILENLALNY